MQLSKAKTSTKNGKMYERLLWVKLLIDVLKFSVIHCEGLSIDYAVLLVENSFIICNSFHNSPKSRTLVYIIPKFTKDETKFQDKLNNGPMNAILGNSRAWFITQFFLTPEHYVLNHYAISASRKKLQSLTLT